MQNFASRNGSRVVNRFLPHCGSLLFTFADMAQLAEQLICNQQVVGSTPITSLLGPMVKRLRHRPFTAVLWVRIPLGSFSIMRTFSSVG